MRQPEPQMPLSGGYDLSALVERANRKDQPASQPASAFVRDITEADMGAIVELSNTVPVILEIYGQGVTPQLGNLIESYGGRLVLATLDAAAAPQLIQALQITGIPTVFAIIQGRPAPLFQGHAPDDQLRQVFDQVLQLAAEQGVTGQIPAPDDSEQGPSEPEQPPLSPEHQRAFDALSNNDLDGAEAAYQEALKKTPSDAEAKAGLANVFLMRRLAGVIPQAARDRAAAEPGNVDAQLSVADVDVSGGHLDDAFVRLLGLYPTVNADDKEKIRQRLLELFDLAGPTHPSVLSARQQLASLLY